MEGADESTELWRHPEDDYCLIHLKSLKVAQVAAILNTRVRLSTHCVKPFSVRHFSLTYCRDEFWQIERKLSLVFF